MSRIEETPMKNYIEQLSEHYGWPLKIHARGYDAYLVGISAGSSPIYRFPGGDSLVSTYEMVPAEKE